MHNNINIIYDLYFKSIYVSLYIKYKYSYLFKYISGDGKLDCKEFKEGIFPFSFKEERTC